MDWLHDGRTIRVELWRNLVLPTTQADPTNPTFDVYAFHDPAFKHPWLLATPVKLKAESVYALYLDRWPVEQIPLTANSSIIPNVSSVCPNWLYSLALS